MFACLRVCVFACLRVCVRVPYLPTHAHNHPPILKMDPIQDRILAWVLSDIQINVLKGVAVSPDDATSRVQSLFRAARVPCEQKILIWQKLRERGPDVCRTLSAADGRDHLRIMWTTEGNLRIWHKG